MPSASVPPPAISRVSIADDSQDPDVWLGAICWIVIAFSAIQILLFGFGRDQAIYATVADGLLHGDLPYRDRWDFKPPGIFFVYATALGTLGKSMMAPRLFEVMGLLLSVSALRRLGESLFGSRLVGLVGAAIAALLHAQLEFWHTGQPETYAGFLTIFAMWLTVRDVSRRRAWLAWCGIGVLFGMAFLLKPPLGGGAVVCAAYLAREQRLADDKNRLWAAAKPFLVVGGASLFPIALCLAWFWARGGLSDLLWTLGKFAPGYTSLSWSGASAAGMFYYAAVEAFFRFSALLAAGFLGCLLLPPLHPREREAIFLVLGIVSMQLAGVAMQGKFFQYHYGATLPLIAFLSGAGYFKIWRRLLSSGPAGVLAFGAFVVVVTSMRDAVRDVPGGFWHRSLDRVGYLMRVGPHSTREELDQALYYVSDYNLDADRRVALDLASRYQKSDGLFVWGFEPGIYWMSGIEPSSRFIYNVPQRAPWQKDVARQRLLEDLKESPPASIVVQSRDVFSYVTGNRLDSRDSLADFPEFEHLLETKYRYVKSIEDFELYERSTPN